MNGTKPLPSLILSALWRHMINTGGKTAAYQRRWRQRGRQWLGAEWVFLSVQSGPCSDAVYTPGRFITGVHYAVMQLSRLLYSSLPAPDSAFLHTRCDSRCGEYLYSHGMWKIHCARPICNFHTHVKFNFLPLHKRLSPSIQASGMLWVPQLTSASVFLLHLYCYWSHGN